MGRLRTATPCSCLGLLVNVTVESLMRIASVKLGYIPRVALIEAA